MKKIIPIILLSSILLTGNIAFIQGSALANLKGSITQAKADYRASLVEIAPLQAQIRANRSEIINLKSQAKTAYNKGKSHLKELSKNKDSLTPSQIESLKGGIIVLQKDKQAVGNTIGDIQKETVNLRTAKAEKNFDQVKDSLNNIIKVQTTRISELQTIIGDMSKISAL